MPEEATRTMHFVNQSKAEPRLNAKEEHVSRKRQRQRESCNRGSNVGINKNKLMKGQYKKGLWAKEEDIKLLELVKQQQQDTTSEVSATKKLNWTIVSKGMLSRSCKQCRERWVNHLNPGVRKTKWTSEEDMLLLSLAKENPRKWAQISRQMPGRTENMVKIRWNSLNKQSSSPRASKVIKPTSRASPSPQPRSTVKSKETSKTKVEIKSYDTLPFIKNSFADYYGPSDYIKGEPFIEEVVLDDLLLDSFFIENSNPSCINSGYLWDNLVPINL